MSREPLRILMLAANPVDHYRLELTEEYRLLRNKMHDNAEAGTCDLRLEWAASLENVKQALRENRPHVVHFSGHGQDDNICLEDDERKSRPLSKRELAVLFNQSRSQIKVVLLNACCSAQQVESLQEQVDFVIGTTIPISDGVALQFTNDFYRAIAVGGTVREAFNKAKGQTADQSGQEGQYKLLVRPGADETEPLLPPSSSIEEDFEVEDEIRASEMNIAGKIYEGVDPASVERPSSNENTKMHLKAKRVKAGKFNFAGTIFKRGE